MTDPRCIEAEKLLSDAGFEGVQVDAAGAALDIAAITASEIALEQLQALSPRIKALGFRYVAWTANQPE
jgi:hypothetical protein